MKEINEHDDKKLQVSHYDDGTPSVMRKKTVYTELHFYRKSDVLVQLTKAFCQRFMPPMATAQWTKWFRRHVQ